MTPDFHRRSMMPIALGSLSTITILSGQFVTAGALYGYSFMGIAMGFTMGLKETFLPSGGGYVLMLVFALLTIALMVILFAGLLCGFGLAIYIAACRNPPVFATILASWLFGGVALSTFSGLALSHWLATRPDFHGEGKVENYYFLWPTLFTLLAVFYALYHRNSRILK